MLSRVEESDQKSYLNVFSLEKRVESQRNAALNPFSPPGGNQQTIIISQFW